jgi:hypothetical protein
MVWGLYTTELLILANASQNLFNLCMCAREYNEHLYPFLFRKFNLVLQFYVTIFLFKASRQVYWRENEVRQATDSTSHWAVILRTSCKYCT